MPDTSGKTQTLTPHATHKLKAAAKTAAFLIFEL
jgi:hypothetical protein